MGDEEQVLPQRDLPPLPPGCCFYPSEKLLISHYLTKKNSDEGGNFISADLIRELNLYNYDPFELPDTACFLYGPDGRKRHWFCFTDRVLSVKRDANTGFWLMKGRVKDISGGAGNVVLGTRTRFVFYAGNSARNAHRTEWYLYEFALVNNPPGSFVLCRVFLKPQRNRGSDTGQSSISEESGSALRNIEIQHDVGVLPVSHITIQNNNINVNKRIENPARCADEEGDRGDVDAPPPPIVAPSHGDNQQGSSNLHLMDQEKNHISGLDTKSQSKTLRYQERLYAIHEEELLRAIREGDFLELNDLV